MTDMKEHLDELSGIYPEEVRHIMSLAQEAVAYAMRTNLATASVLGGYGLIMPDSLRDMLYSETLQSCLYILSQEELNASMKDDPDGSWTSPIDLFVRGYLMGFELMLCRGARSSDTLWHDYGIARAEHPEQDMRWLHDMVLGRVEPFGQAARENPGPIPVEDQDISEIARSVEARIGKMFIDSEPDAQERPKAWWQCLVDGTIKGAIATISIGFSLPEAAQVSLVQRYGCALVPGTQDDLRAQATVTKIKDF